MPITLRPEPLTSEAFAPFGDVIELHNAKSFPINKGFTIRHHDLAKVDVSDQDGNALISIFRCQPRTQPLQLDLMERHPLGSQAFYPLQNQNWLVVVASGCDPCDPQNLHVFTATGQQGVNYARNTWHHPLLVHHHDSDFFIVDRGGPGNNLEERQFSETVFIEI